MCTIANWRRQKPRNILEPKDNIGLTKVGSQQLMSFRGMKMPTARRPLIFDLEPSSAKVLDYLFEKELDDLPACFDGKQLQDGPEAKRRRKPGWGTIGGRTWKIWTKPGCQSPHNRFYVEFRSDQVSRGLFTWQAKLFYPRPLFVANQHS